MQYLVFTFHKAGSMALHAYLGWIAGAAGLPHHSPNNENAPQRQQFCIKPAPSQDDPNWWMTTGRHLDGIIGPLRRPIVLPSRLKTRGAILVRDPRDALTSMYYSFTFSHGGVSDANRQRRIEMGIDRFALQRLPDLKKRLVRYRAMLGAQPNWPLLRYEDMVLRFDRWLPELIDGFALKLDRSAVATFAAAKAAEYKSVIAQRRKAERTDLHMRYVAPGDHLTKLAPETIARIDAALAQELTFFGYARAGGKVLTAAADCTPQANLP